jgi:hypothetical protein
MVEGEKSSVVTVRLSKRNLRRVEAVRALENVDRSTLFKEFIEDGLRASCAFVFEGQTECRSRCRDFRYFASRIFGVASA